MIDATPQSQDIATDGTCGLSWDDGQITSMTPTPSARCPFENFHMVRIRKGISEPLPLDPDDIPKDWIVQPIRATKG